MVIGSGDRALGRKARVESIRAPVGIPARDFAPKPHAHDPVAMPCVGVVCNRPIDARQPSVKSKALQTVLIEQSQTLLAMNSGLL